MRKTSTIFAVVTLFFAFAASAQHGGGTQYPDPSYGGDGGSQTCWRCVVVSDLDMYCSGMPIGSNNYGGMSGCQASGHVYPPQYASCTLFGTFCYGAPIGRLELQWRKGKVLRYALAPRCSARVAL